MASISVVGGAMLQSSIASDFLPSDLSGPEVVAISGDLALTAHTREVVMSVDHDLLGQDDTRSSRSISIANSSTLHTTRSCHCQFLHGYVPSLLFQALLTWDHCLAESSRDQQFRALI